MRGTYKETPRKGESLFRTMAMACIIASIISFVAMFWPLRKAAPEGAGLPYYLPWCLPYGIVDLGIAATGVAFTTLSKEKPGLYKPGNIVGIVFSSLLIAQAFPIVIVFGNWEFFLSVAAIGACVLAISILGLTSLKEDNPA